MRIRVYFLGGTISMTPAPPTETGAGPGVVPALGGAELLGGPRIPGRPGRARRPRTGGQLGARLRAVPGDPGAGERGGAGGRGGRGRGGAGHRHPRGDCVPLGPAVAARRALRGDRGDAPGGCGGVGRPGQPAQRCRGRGLTGLRRPGRPGRHRRRGPCRPLRHQAPLLVAGGLRLPRPRAGGSGRRARPGVLGPRGSARRSCRPRSSCAAWRWCGRASTTTPGSTVRPASWPTPWWWRASGPARCAPRWVPCCSSWPATGPWSSPRAPARAGSPPPPTGGPEPARTSSSGGVVSAGRLSGLKARVLLQLLVSAARLPTPQEVALAFGRHGG